jgi:DNA modification methylase
MEKQKANVTGLDKGINYRMENGAITGLRAPTKYATNHHPTVKPTNLMQYLCRLVTPPNGTILDPFLGSGSTGKAAMYEGFNFVGFDLNSEYIDIAKARIEYAINSKEQSLFDHE